MNIVFIVVCQFPYGSASSMRARFLYKLLNYAGHTVHVISDFDSENQQMANNDYSYEAVFDQTTSFVKRQMVHHKSLELLKKYCKNNKVDCVLSNARFDRFSKLARYCKKNNLPLYVENCEWYDVSNFKLGYFDWRYHLNQRMIKYGFKNADGFISISRLLDEHNSGLGKKSVRIPTILDVKNTEYNTETNNNKYTLVYTGNPGKSKEYLLPIIETIADSDIFREKFEFHIYGPSKKTVIDNISGNISLLSKAGDAVTIHGKIPQKEINNVLINADFMIFLRPDRRSSNAGFPTKLGESFAVGTPVITNSTGDIDLYVRNNKNGYIVNLNDKESIKNTFLRILDLSKDEYELIRINARNTAEESFDYRTYRGLIGELIKSK